jgi:prepilin-type N-terminal cleavage/methylation domain-containing protein
VIRNKVSKPKSAYTLIELSIVILIISVLMMGGLTITISSLNKAKKISTQNKINEIYNAVGKFLLENKRLPCPASLTLTKDSNLYGVESRDGSGECNVSLSKDNLYYGMVPAKTLNLPLNMGEDYFGGKISYIIDKRFATNFQDNISNKTTGFGTTQAYTGAMTIYEKPSSISRAITADAILIILSHGLNKFGAFNNNATVQNARSSDSDESENDANSGVANGFDKNFIYNSQNSKIFDDVMIFKTRNQIVQDFNAFYLIACLDDGSANPYGNKSVYYGQNLYGTKCTGTGFTYDKIPEKYCDRFGRWHEINRCESWL